MTKALYTYLPDAKDFITSLVADDYTPQTNETFTEPKGADGTGIKLPVTFDGTNWIEATDEEHKTYQDAVDAAYKESHPGFSAQQGPTQEQQMINALGKQVAQLQAQLAQSSVTSTSTTTVATEGGNA